MALECGVSLRGLIAEETIAEIESRLLQVGNNGREKITGREKDCFL